ncbi:MAG TPA: YceI family protein [Puia sp.]
MKKFILLLALTACASVSFGQLYFTRSGVIGFYSRTPLEDIKAENNQVYALIDIGKKTIAFSSLLKGFIFPKELMQEHFNENYVESDKYPKASFTGSFTGDIDIKKDGLYQVDVKGQLSLHNTTRDVETPATLEVRSGMLLGTAQFKIRPEEYHIDIPSVVRDKIAKEFTITIKAGCSPK